MAETAHWRGVVIAEGLRDPTVVNELHVDRAFITGDDQPLEDGDAGRWHLYWVDVTDEQLDALEAGIRHGWYAHFWQGERLLVVFDDARFALGRHDRAGWDAAIEHGLRQGLRREWLDFPTDDSAGYLVD
jgi:hypothetical protein